MLPLKKGQTYEEALKTMLRSRLKQRNSKNKHTREWARIGAKQALSLLRLGKLH